MGGAGCLAEAASPELKFTFAAWLPSTVKWLLRGCEGGPQGHSLCFHRLVGNEAPGRKDAAGDTIKVEGMASGRSDLPRGGGWRSGKHLKASLAAAAGHLVLRGGEDLTTGPSIPPTRGQEEPLDSLIGWLELTSPGLAVPANQGQLPAPRAPLYKFNASASCLLIWTILCKVSPSQPPSAALETLHC